MATTSSSPERETPFLLRVREVRRDEGQGRADAPQGQPQARTHVFSLYEAGSLAHELDVADGTVRESVPYVLDLLCPEDLGFIRLDLSVNGEALDATVSRVTWEKVSLGGQDYFWYCLTTRNAATRDGDGRPFAMSYGFVRVGLELRAEDGRTLSLTTKDIPCLSSGADQRRIVTAMLDELDEADQSAPLRWMLSGHTSEDPLALLDGAATDEARSLSAYLALIEAVLAGYGEALPYLRMRPHAKTVSAYRLVRPEEVRTVGRQELAWIAQNATAAGREARPRRIRAERTVRSFDNYENRSVLSFLSTVSDELSRLERAGEASVAYLESVRTNLARLDTEAGGGLMLGVVIADASLARQRPRLERIRRLRSRSKDLLLLYADALPCEASRSFHMPRRTKVFQEVGAYARLFGLMERWRTFGDYRIERDGLVLHTLRMDRLYEYYALFRLLDWLHTAGFEPDAAFDEPVQTFRYSLRAPLYDPEDDVANVYRLSRGGERVTLHYQPVVYGDLREEAGVSLHRTTARTPFDRQGPDSYWLPDFLLTHETAGGTTTTVLDAKFRSCRTLQRGGRGQAGGDGDARSAFDECARKYRFGMAKADGRPVDGMWLLCGRAERQELLPYQTSSWARSRGLRADGIATLAPGASSLDALFAAIGVAAEAPGANAGTVETASATKAEEGPRPPQDVAGAQGTAAPSMAPEMEETVRKPAGGTEASRPKVVEATEGPAVPSAPEGVVPTPEPVAEATNEPAPVAEAAAEPEPQPVAEAAAEPAPEPAPMPAAAVEPGPEPAPMPAAAVEPEPIPAAEQVPEAAEPEPVAGAPTEPAAAQQAAETGPTPEAADQSTESAHAAPPTSDAAEPTPAPEIDPATLSLIERYCEQTPRKEMLLNARAAQRFLGLSHPLLRDKAPTGRERKSYTRKPMQVAGGSYYVFRGWTPPLTKRLERAVRQNERRSGS